MEEETVHFFSENLQESHFRERPLWCPYQVPSELNDLRQWGVSEAQIKAQILDRLELSHCHPSYSIPEHGNIGDRDLLYLAVEAEFPGNSLRRFGYLVISDREATGLTVYHLSAGINLYCDASLACENLAELTNILGAPPDGDIEVKIHPKRIVSGHSCPVKISPTTVSTR